jgi:hypothetical protein
MKIFSVVRAAPTLLAAAALLVGQGVRAETGVQLVREAQRQQSAAERTSCAGVQRSISSGTDASLVVRTAVELGYNSCQVIRCALEGEARPDKPTLCKKVIRGAVAAGVQADVISRCASESCDPDAIAAILADTLLEPNYCYFSPRLPAAPEPLQHQQGGYDRQISPYTFP